MYLLSTQGFFSDSLVKAVCWVLVHSLWQGLLLAGISGGIVLFTKQRSAALRYNLLTSALLIFVAGVALNVYLQLHNSFMQTTLLVQPEGGSQISAAIATAGDAPVTHISFMDLIAGFFNRNAAAIVFVWFLVIGVKMARMMAGLYSIQQIKKRKLSTAGSYWSLRVQQLSHQLGIKHTVQFFQSGIVKVPMVIGYFKPIILFPVGALASLSPADVEAILLHELAHIRRRDYLVNMLQHVVEILFFFNPAVLWVSAIIKTERENCCDDIALAHTSNRHGYVNALVSFQEFDQAQPAYATALTGKKDHLFQRVKRIVTNNNKSLNNMEKIFLVICFLFTGTLTLVFAQKKTALEKFTAVQTGKTVKKTTVYVYDETEAIKQMQSLEENATLVYSDKTANPRRHFISKRNGNIYEIYGDITWFKINGKTIPQENWKAYEAIINDMMNINEEVVEKYEAVAPYETQAAIQLLTDKEVAQDKKAAVVQKEQHLQDSLQAEVYKAVARDVKNITEKDKAIQFSDKNELEKQRRIMEAERKRTDAETEKANDEKKTTNKSTTSVKVERVVDTDKYRTITGLTYNSVNTNISANINNRINTNVHIKDIDVSELTNKITADLKTNGIITTTDNLSYQLNNDQLIVNNVVQPAAIHAALKANYIKSADWKLMYNWKQKVN